MFRRGFCSGFAECRALEACASEGIASGMRADFVLPSSLLDWQFGHCDLNSGHRAELKMAVPSIFGGDAFRTDVLEDQPWSNRASTV